MSTLTELRNNPQANSAIQWLLYNGFDLSSVPHDDDSIPQEWILIIHEHLLQVNSLTHSVYFMYELQHNYPSEFDIQLS